MGLINWALTYVLFGREKAELVATFNYMDVQARWRNEEILEEMRLEHHERMAMERQKR